MLRLLAPLKAAAAPAVPLIDIFLFSALSLQEPAQTWARMHHKHKTGTYRHVGLAPGHAQRRVLHCWGARLRAQACQPE